MHLPRFRYLLLALSAVLFICVTPRARADHYPASGDDLGAKTLRSHPLADRVWVSPQIEGADCIDLTLRLGGPGGKPVKVRYTGGSASCQPSNSLDVRKTALPAQVREPAFSEDAWNILMPVHRQLKWRGTSFLLVHKEPEVWLEWGPGMTLHLPEFENNAINLNAKSLVCAQPPSGGRDCEHHLGLSRAVGDYIHKLELLRLAAAQRLNLQMRALHWPGEIGGEYGYEIGISGFDESTLVRGHTSPYAPVTLSRESFDIHQFSRSADSADAIDPAVFEERLATELEAVRTAYGEVQRLNGTAADRDVVLWTRLRDKTGKRLLTFLEFGC